VEYNKKSAKFEATLTLTSHDLEAFLKKENLIVNSLDKALVDETEFSSIEKVINSNFFFYSDASGDKPNWVSSFKIDGHQILLNGNIEIYLSCDLIESWTKLNVQFSLLMDYFPEQQNKITFIQKRKKTTLNFTSTNQNQPIELF
jgi:hypothetical protein